MRAEAAVAVIDTELAKAFRRTNIMSPEAQQAAQALEGHELEAVIALHAGVLLSSRRTKLYHDEVDLVWAARDAVQDARNAERLDRGSGKNNES